MKRKEKKIATNNPGLHVQKKLYSVKNKQKNKTRSDGIEINSSSISIVNLLSLLFLKENALLHKY